MSVKAQLGKWELFLEKDKPGPSPRHCPNLLQDAANRKGPAPQMNIFKSRNQLIERPLGLFSKMQRRKLSNIMEQVPIWLSSQTRSQP